MDGAEVNLKHERFEALVLPHLDASFNMARWMMGDEAQARDAVQNAAMRALSYIANLRGANGRAWFFGIVRNVCLDALRERSARYSDLDVIELLEGSDESGGLETHIPGPDHELERRATQDNVNATLRALPVAFREVLVLREIEDMSYDEIALVTGVPVGTVMSRLSRARRQFRVAFATREERGAE